MRPSPSLSRLSNILSRISTLPDITVTSASVEILARRESHKVRRWRGCLDNNRDLYLHPPSQGDSKGARIALARQGSATGSFRLNCDETPYARDEAGRCLFQRMDLQEELEMSKNGLMERPSLRTTNLHPPPRTAHALKIRRRDSAKSLLADIKAFSLRKKAARGLRSSKAQGTSLGNLSSSLTFSEGLCNLATYEAVNPSKQMSKSPPLQPLLSSFEAADQISNIAINRTSQVGLSVSWSLQSLVLRPVRPKLAHNTLTPETILEHPGDELSPTLSSSSSISSLLESGKRCFDSLRKLPLDDITNSFKRSRSRFQPAGSFEANFVVQEDQCFSFPRSVSLSAGGLRNALGFSVPKTPIQQDATVA